MEIQRQGRVVLTNMKRKSLSSKTPKTIHQDPKIAQGTEKMRRSWNGEEKRIWGRRMSQNLILKISTHQDCDVARSVARRSADCTLNCMARYRALKHATSMKNVFLDSYDFRLTWSKILPENKWCMFEVNNRCSSHQPGHTFTPNEISPSSLNQMSETSTIRHLTWLPIQGHKDNSSWILDRETQIKWIWLKNKGPNTNQLGKSRSQNVTNPHLHVVESQNDTHSHISVSGSSCPWTIGPFLTIIGYKNTMNNPETLERKPSLTQHAQKMLTRATCYEPAHYTVSPEL